VILDLPFPFACSVTMRDGSGLEAGMFARAALAVCAPTEAEAPLALRWGPRGSPDGDWSHTRFHEGTHLLPVGPADEDPRLACARALLSGWEGTAGPAPPLGPFLREDDPYLARVLRHDRPAREAGLRARALALRVVAGRAYVPCPEPVAVETGPGLAEIRVVRGVDWIGVLPLAELATARGPRLLQGHEVLLPAALTIDRAAVAARVVRKALIVLRKACEADAIARRRAAEAESGLAAGQPRRAAEAMALCLRALRPSASVHEGLREFVARTEAYLGGYLAPA